METKNKQPKDKVALCFSKFENLRSIDISLVMDDTKATMVIKGKRIDVLPQDLGLKKGHQGWKLLEGAAAYGGDFTNALRKLNKTTNREKEKNKVKTAISRLRNSLSDSMGLSDDPILEDDGAYRLSFNTVTHAMFADGCITKGDDAHVHRDNKRFDENEHGDNDDFYGEGFNPADMGDSF